MLLRPHARDQKTDQRHGRSRVPSVPQRGGKRECAKLPSLPWGHRSAPEVCHISRRGRSLTPQHLSHAGGGDQNQPSHLHQRLSPAKGISAGKEGSRRNFTLPLMWAKNLLFAMEGFQESKSRVNPERALLAPRPRTL